MKTCKYLWYFLLFWYHGARMNMFIKQKKPLKIVQDRHTLSEHYYEEMNKIISVRGD